MKIEKDRKQVLRSFLFLRKEKKRYMAPIFCLFLPDLQISRLTLRMRSGRRYQRYYSFYLGFISNER